MIKINLKLNKNIHKNYPVIKDVVIPVLTGLE